MQQALATITKLLQPHMVVQDLGLSPASGAVSEIPKPRPSLSFPGPDADKEFTAVGSQGFVFESPFTLFESLDRDRDGHITREEYNAGFHVMDRDGDRKLSKLEFNAECFGMFYGDANACLSREEYEAGFNLLDTDRDGFITKTNAIQAHALALAHSTRLGAFPTKLSLGAQATGTRVTQKIGTSNCSNMQKQEKQVMSQKDVKILLAQLDPIKAHHDRKQEPQPMLSIDNSIVLKNANNILSKITKNNTLPEGAMYKLAPMLDALAPRVERIRNQDIASSTMPDGLDPARARIKRDEVAVDNSRNRYAGRQTDRQATTRPDSNFSRFASADVVTVDLMRRRMRTSNEQPLTSDPLPLSMSLALSPPHSALSSLVFPPPQLPPLLPLSQILRDTSLCSQSPFTRDFRETPQSSNPASYNNIHHSPAKLS